ncbi:MAG: hypothetical protein WDZ35_16065 [Crocinitomicaceae bacterium]
MKNIIVLLALLLLFSCNKQDFSDKPTELSYYEPFKTTSPFYDSIPASANVDPNSSTMVGSLVDQADQAFIVVAKEWTTTVFYADENTPTHDVKMTATWAPHKKLQNVPIPEFAEADPSGDGHMVIIDEAAGCAYDFWQAKYSNGWKASWGNAIPLDSDGIFEKGLSARGSGFELLQGMIWPQELEAGEINHALIFSYDHTAAGGPVAPATESDGTTNAAWAIPEGALVRLDPTLDLNSLNLNSYEMTIAKCLQKYGMYCADDGGGLSLYAINPLSCQNNPYENIWGDQTYVDMSKIPVDQFQVMEMGAQSETEAVVVGNSCAEFK